MKKKLQDRMLGDLKEYRPLHRDPQVLDVFRDSSFVLGKTIDWCECVRTLDKARAFFPVYFVRRAHSNIWPRRGLLAGLAFGRAGVDRLSNRGTAIKRGAKSLVAGVGYFGL